MQVCAAFMYEQIKTLISDQLRLAQNSPQAKKEDSLTRQCVVARQPIFDVKGQVWGYELLYRRPEQLDAANFHNGTIATASVIVNGYDMVRPGIREHQKLLINFPASLIETQVLRLLPPQTCVAEVLEDVEPTPAVLAALTELKEAGYTIALDDYIGQEQLAAFLPLADIIKIDVLGMESKDIMALASRARLHHCQLLAEKVEDQETANLCRRFGFTLFQGYFFSRPELVKGRHADGSQLARMRVLSLCVNENTPLADLAEAVLHDPVITAKFLKFVNSAYFGLPNRVRTVGHALALVGRLTFAQWLCVSVLATIDSGALAQELAFLASQRAKFLESLALALRSRGKMAPEIVPYDLFLAGLFSLFESFMSLPMENVLEGIPLNPNVADALMGKESPCSVWLDLALRYERGDWENSIPIALSLGLTEAELSSAYAEAVKWSSVFYNGDDADAAGATPPSEMRIKTKEPRKTAR